jgi:hypothetical protein
LQPGSKSGGAASWHGGRDLNHGNVVMQEPDDCALYIKLTDLPPGITLEHFYKTVRPADESGWPAARELWQEIFQYWDKQKDKR